MSNDFRYVYSLRPEPVYPSEVMFLVCLIPFAFIIYKLLSTKNSFYLIPGVIFGLILNMQVTFYKEEQRHPTVNEEITAYLETRGLGVTYRTPNGPVIFPIHRGLVYPDAVILYRNKRK